jgi:hypothetical protein
MGRYTILGVFFNVIKLNIQSVTTVLESHFLDNRLTDSGEVVSLTRRPPFIPQEDSWYSFLLQA